MARNGLHFTPEGYAMLGKAVARAIRSELVALEQSRAEITYTRQVPLDIRQ